MRCTACGAEIAGAFPGATLVCACGEKNVVTYTRPTAPPPSAGPYRTSDAGSSAHTVRVPCPFCSFEIDPSASKCPRCAVDLELARCPRCRALCHLGERHCALCNAELPRTASGDATDAPCPRCEGTLIPVLDEELAQDALHTCAKCGGIFLGHRTLARAAERLRQGGPLPAILLEHVDPPPDEVVYLRCPCCLQQMNRKRLAKMVVDVCRVHGTWFDRGELARVLSEPLAPEPEKKSLPQTAREAIARAQVEGVMEQVRVERQLGFVKAFLAALFGGPYD